MNRIIGKLLTGFVFIVFVGASFSQQNQDHPVALEQPVRFIGEAPAIDGVLDESLTGLPQYQFNKITKKNDDNPIINTSFRLAYGADFFYAFIEVEKDELVVRDRAYQNGDGFHMALTFPKPDDERTDEFYVMGFSPVEFKPGIPFRRKFIWYRNIDLSFDNLKNTVFEVAQKDGKLGFELLLPWSEVYPYHPWLSEAIGFNLCYVQAVGEVSKNYYYVVHDQYFQSEQRKRLSAKLTFEEPTLSEGLQTYMILGRNHGYRGKQIEAKVAVLTSSAEEVKFYTHIWTGEGTRIKWFVNEFDVDEGLSFHRFDITTSELVSGGYQVSWYPAMTELCDRISMSILPEIDLDDLGSRLGTIRKKVKPGSITTLEFQIEDIENRLSGLKPYDTAPQLRFAFDKTLSIIQDAEKGHDVIAEKKGIQRRAYRSRVDNTLQPYSIEVPEHLPRNEKSPLLIFLHGSGVDDRGQLNDLRTPGYCIELAPRGRGTSTNYCEDHAQDDIREAMADVMANYTIDKSNVILTGVSMGGYGVYRTFHENPGAFKALAVFSGHTRMGDINFLEKKYLEPFKGVEIFIYHGGRDRNCPTEETLKIVELLKDVGARVDFYLEEEKGHDMPSPKTLAAYYDWLKRMLAK